MSAHTHGQWVALHQPARDAEIARVAWVGDWCVGVMTPSFPGGNYRDTEFGDVAADAKLIAAAPDLLYALQKLDECYCEASDEMSRAQRAHHRKVLIAARAAVAKATGAQP